MIFGFIGIINRISGNLTLNKKQNRDKIQLCNEKRYLNKISYYNKKLINYNKKKFIKNLFKNK